MWKAEAQNQLRTHTQREGFLLVRVKWVKVMIKFRVEKLRRVILIPTEKENEEREVMINEDRRKKVGRPKG